MDIRAIKWRITEIQTYFKYIHFEPTFFLVGTILFLYTEIKLFKFKLMR